MKISIFLWSTNVSYFEEGHQATSVIGTQMMINLSVWYSHIILPMKNNKSTPESTWDSDDSCECHDRQVLSW